MDGPPDLQMNRPSGPRQYLRPKVTSQITGYSQSHIWRMEKVGTFPKRYKLGPNAVGHDAHEVYTWMRNRVRGNCCAVPGKRVEKNSSVDPVNSAALKLLGTERTVEITEDGEDDEDEDGGEDE